MGHALLKLSAIAGIIGLFVVVMIAVRYSSGRKNVTENPKRLPEKQYILLSPKPAAWTEIQDPASITILTIIELPGDATINDQTLLKLRQFPNLKTLVLGSRSITDQGFKHIFQLQNLEGLIVYECNISDEGIQELTTLPKLKTVGIHGTKVSQSALARLQANMPNAYFELGEYGRNGKLFDENGCVTVDFEMKHMGFASSTGERRLPQHSRRRTVSQCE